MVATLVVFFIRMFPANQATEHWTTLPEQWEALRAQREYRHVVSAVITVVALSTVTTAVLRRG